MPKRVHELAKELGVTSKDVLAAAATLGLDVSNHMSSLTDAEAEAITVALPAGAAAAATGADAPGENDAAAEAAAAEDAAEEVGHISWFDKSSGQGEVEVPSKAGATKSMPFDLRRTRLEDSSYVPIEPGLEVSVTVDEDEVKSLRSRRMPG